MNVNTAFKVRYRACYIASMSMLIKLFATVFTLDAPLSVKYPLFRGVPLFDSCMRRLPCTTESGLIDC